jgi:hypothetical protein
MVNLGRFFEKNGLGLLGLKNHMYLILRLS